MASSPIVALHVKLDGESWIQLNPNDPLIYRQEKLFVVGGDQLTGDYKVGERYTVTVKAEFADGGFTAVTMGVMCIWELV